MNTRLTLSSLLKPVLPSIIGVFLCGFASAGFTLLSPIAVTRLALGALRGDLDSPSALFWLAMILIGFSLSHLLVGGATSYAHMVEFRFRRELRERIARHVSRLPLGWFVSESSGRIRTIIAEDVTKIHTIIAHFGVDLGAGVGTLLLGSAYLIALSWPYALVLLVWLLVSLALFTAAMMLNPASGIEEFTEAEKDLSSSTVEMVDGIATVKAFGMSNSLFRRFSAALDRYTTASYEWMKGPGRPMAVLMVLISPAGMLVPFLLVGVALPSGLDGVIPLAHLLTQGKDAAERIGALLAEEPLPEAEHPLTIDPAAPAEVVLEDVSFRYRQDAPYALRNVSARFPAGSVTAVVGPSGSGKSTLVKLIARFWDTNEGRILVSGAPIKELATPALLSQLAIVLQDGGLLSDSVTENIRLGRPDATEEEIVEAAKSALIHERILELPRGYDSVIGTEGAHFSGGEAQRLALARAFLSDSRILLLDEATAQADPHSERRIQEALGALARNRTTIVIAHRLATVVDADQILVLDQGRLVDSGTHTELLARKGVYADMWKAQQ